MRVSNVADVRGLCNSLEDGGVDSGSLNPRGVLSRWVLLGQCQAFAVAVEQIGGDEGGGAEAGEDVELDHISGLWGREGEEPRDDNR